MASYRSISPSSSYQYRSDTELLERPNGQANSGYRIRNDGVPLRQFWKRAISCLVAPLLVTVYFGCIWLIWLKQYDNGGPVAHGPKNARWIYYGWFVVSTIAIGISRYGLSGVEASMLMDEKWAAKNAMQLMPHCDKVSC